MSNTDGRAQSVVLSAILVTALAFAVGCRQDMHDQPAYTALETSAFFEDGRSSRPPVEGTVARGQLRDDDHLYTGKVDGAFVRSFPFPVTLPVMQRGRERYDIFCSPCHDRLGTGRGMVVRRGFPQAASYHIDRLREVEEGYLYDVVTNGFGRMSGYASQIPVEDRWAIVAYIRALQHSQNAPLSDVPAGARSELTKPEAAR
ncbi:MAG TPA: cytochrome c [Candidatus Polarisedimenticolia bacterium]|nr:cytochrome c [Candidatus Polarisedimenticolia bacterium]